MVSLLIKKGSKDLMSKKVRTILTVLTISLGVAEISLFAVNPLARETMKSEMEKQNLNNLVIRIGRANLTDEDLDELTKIENVEGVEARALLFTKMYVGEAREDVLIVGVRNFTDQKVDRIILDSGEFPECNKILNEKVNGKNGIFQGSEGDTIVVFDSDANEAELEISGTGRSLAHGKTLYDYEGYAVVYAPLKTVENLSGESGFNYLSFTLFDTDGESVDGTLGEIERCLEINSGPINFSRLPEVREDDDWPGGEYLEMILNIMYILTLIALISSAFLISNTMNTLVSERKKEVAMLKAIGATRVQVIKPFMVSSLTMGLAGSILGCVFGIGISYIVLLYFGSIMGFHPTSYIHLHTVIISLIFGILLVGLSSLPSVIRASRISVLDGMNDPGTSSSYGKGLIDRILIALRWMPKGIVMGLRNAGRKKGRSVTTVLQVCLAVGIFLGLLSFGYSLGKELESTVGNLNYDIDVVSQGGETIPENTSTTIIMAEENVTSAEPYLESTLMVQDIEIHAMGYVPDTEVKLHSKTIVEGRWFKGVDENSIPEAVLGKQISNRIGAEVGDVMKVETALGVFDLEVVGLDDDFYYQGLIVYLPLSKLQQISGNEDLVNGFFIQVNGDEDVIDRSSREIEDRLLEMGYIVEGQEMHTIRESTVRQNRSIVNMVTLVSTVIVLISFIGLTSNLTMNILERTKEIGMLRCIGSQSRQIRVIFTSEAMLLTITGWIIGIPLGYAISKAVSFSLDMMLEWEIPVEYPLRYIGISILVVSLGSFIISQGPISRATRLRPGDALRYE